MGLTQKYKQQVQQVRVLTNENNYLKGMWFTDTPLAEGYSRVLVNFDINSLSGALTPRKGLQFIGFAMPHETAQQYLNNASGFNIVVKSKICATPDAVDPRKTNKQLQSILYNTDTRTLLAAVSDANFDKSSVLSFTAEPFSINAADEFVAPEPFIIAEPQIHGMPCVHNNYFKRPVGAFAFGDSFYTFLRHSRYEVTKLADLPNDDFKNLNDEPISSYLDLKNNSLYSTGEPGQYFVFTAGESIGVIAYYNTDGEIAMWEGSEEALLRTVLPVEAPTFTLCYTKADVQEDEVLLDATLQHDKLDPKKYYVCVAQPKRLNPTEASSWGYNMLLDDPYDFTCEDTAVNLVTITGILPYDKSGNITLTPRKNQEITLKGFYRAPRAYHSDAQEPRFYATTKQKITVTEQVISFKQDEYGKYEDTHGNSITFGYITVGENNNIVQRYYYIDANEQLHIVPESDLVTVTEEVTVTRDPKTIDELLANVIDLDTHRFGDWWYATDDELYYMVMPDGDLTEKKIDLFGDTQPAASEKLSGATEGTENKIRVRWQIRSGGAATWTDIYNEEILLSEEYERNGDQHTPFTVTTTLPDNEVLIKLTVTDVADVTEDEEYILSTNTIGLSLVSDELANTLNLDTKNFNLGQATGMCEWEQRLVLWGVPDALNTLFVSDVNNPTFFPYPNNIDIFPDPIIAVHNYGDELLVLTTTALYRLIWDVEGTGWTHTLVQQNLHVTEADTYLSCVIKNMFFFKSRDYYYLMVPKTASATGIRGEVTIAPISKPIEGLLSDFHNNIADLAHVISDNGMPEDFTKNLVNYFSYVDNTKIVVNYVYALDETSIETSRYLYVQLIYDTDLRTWTIRMFEAAHMLYASHIDALQQDQFIDVTPILNQKQLALQYYKFNNSEDAVIQYLDADDGFVVNTTATIKNYQYLDTGNREVNTELKKRFREFQFKLKNKDATNLGFFTSFLIDGSLRKDLQHYTPRLITGDNAREGTIVIERTLDPGTMTYNTTRVERILVPERMLQDDGELLHTTLAQLTDPDCWVLNQSAFPGRTLWKVRMPISGKGYTPRAILLSTNQAEYELYGDAWVYRTMNGR